MVLGSDGPAEKDIVRDKVRKLYSAYQKGYYWLYVMEKYTDAC